MRDHDDLEHSDMKYVQSAFSLIAYTNVQSIPRYLLDNDMSVQLIPYDLLHCDIKCSINITRCLHIVIRKCVI